MLEWRQEEPMSARLKAVAAAALLAAASPAGAHHSFTIFDTEHPVELTGTVQEFRFSSPHAVIVLEVKGDEGKTTTWSLEGTSPSILVRDGWSSRSLKAGDEVTVTIDPLRSGAPGGSWIAQRINFLCGRPVVAAPDGL
jgi:Family of unknown function (DUF6152)